MRGVRGGEGDRVSFARRRKTAGCRKKANERKQIAWD